jgi:hypothetical protein
VGPSAGLDNNAWYNFIFSSSRKVFGLKAFRGLGSSLIIFFRRATDLFLSVRYLKVANIRYI